MTTGEFSDQFDVLYNNITSNQAPGLDEYEKSVFLTKAQDEIVKNYFSEKSNKLQTGFDGSQKRQADFSMLMRSGSTEISSSNKGEFATVGFKIELPEATDKVFIIINEQVLKIQRTVTTPSVEPGEPTSEPTVNDTLMGVRQIIPISYDEYTRLMSKPYQSPLKRQAWRIFSDGSANTSKRYMDIVLTPEDRKYLENGTYNYMYDIRFIKRPRPIILTNISDAVEQDVTIGGESTAQTCELDPILHEEILQRAVELAKIAWSGDVNASVQSGQRSE